MSWDSNLGHLEGEVASVTDEPGADLDQLLLEVGQRPIFDRLRCRQGAEEVTKIVGDRMKLKANSVGRERPA